MPEIDILVGGRRFIVSCRAGEEHFLNAAARMLDSEAQPILSQLGRLPEARMLLMAGLMLADRTASLEDELREARERIAALEARPPGEVVRVEVPVVPASVSESLAEIAARAEALAAQVEEKVA